MRTFAATYGCFCIRRFYAKDVLCASFFYVPFLLLSLLVVSLPHRNEKSLL